ncbi:MAG: sulfatase-like hydrolase/transferase [Planctomycetota bacterium]
MFALKRLLPLCCAAAAIFTGAVSWADPPNILWIITDDQSTDMGAYGTPGLNTPRMDQLASEGVLYQNAYATSPACSPSRTAMMVGMYQTSLPVAMHHRPSSRQPLPAGVAPVSEYFQANGYFVGNAQPDFTGQGKFDMNFANPDGSALSFDDLFDGTDWRQAGDQPWFMQVNIFEPHRPFSGGNTSPGRTALLDLPGNLPDHPLARADYADYLASIETADALVGSVLDRLEADGLADNTIVFFFSDNGREFTGAKGTAYDAGVNVPLVVRVPEAYRDDRPDLGPGTVNTGLVSMLDVTAASLAAAGIDLGAPELSHLHGVDMLAAGFGGREAVFSANDRSGNRFARSRTVRVGDLAYIFNYNTNLSSFGLDAHWYSRSERPIHALLEVMRGRGLLTEEDGLLFGDQLPREELYDLASDPYQQNNLADDPAYAEHLLDFRTRLTDWSLSTGDLGGQPDPDRQAATNWFNSTGRFRYLDTKGLPRDTTDYEYLQWWAGELGVPIDLAEGRFDTSNFWIPNRSFENTTLSNGGFSGGVPQGWTDATPNAVWVQNLTAGALTQEATDGQNAVNLNQGGGELRWLIDDNWGNTLSAEEAAASRFDISADVGRRLGFQGETPGVLRVSLQTQDGTIVAEQQFSLDGVQQGTFQSQAFSLLVDRGLAAEYGDQQLYLALANVVTATGGNGAGRVVLDALDLAITMLPAADYDYNGVVDMADYAVWQSTFGSIVELDADGNGDGIVDGADYALWRNTFGQSVTFGSLAAVPEPAGAGALAIALMCLLPQRAGRRCCSPC